MIGLHGFSALWDRKPLALQPTAILAAEYMPGPAALKVRKPTEPHRIPARGSIRLTKADAALSQAEMKAAGRTTRIRPPVVPAQALTLQTATRRRIIHAATAAIVAAGASLARRHRILAAMQATAMNHRNQIQEALRANDRSTIARRTIGSPLEAHSPRIRLTITVAGRSFLPAPTMVPAREILLGTAMTMPRRAALAETANLRWNCIGRS